MASAEKPVGAGGYYSGANPIPTIQEFIQSLDSSKNLRDKEIDEAEKKQKAKEPAAQKVQQQTEQQTTNGTNGATAPQLVAKRHQKIVTDPVTGKDVVIEHAKRDVVNNVRDPKLSVPNANLGKETTAKTEPTQSGEEYRYNQDITAPPAPVEPGSTTDVPLRGEKTNVLFHHTPSVSYESMYTILEKQAGAVCIAIFFAVVFLGRLFGGRLVGLVLLAMCLTSGVWLWMKEVVRSGREIEWHSERQRGQTATANLLPESVEWMNTLLEVCWGMVNPDMFQTVADTLEDVMQASLPGIVEQIRVAEINQGSNPVRVLSLRSLPDDHVKEMKEFIHEQNKRSKDPQEAAADEEGGDYYNLELAVAYHALPTSKRASDKARNMHMQLVFYLGIKGLFGVPLPIFVELQRLVATVRLRLHMTREPPFLKTLTFTMMGVPHISVGCIPILEKGVNILNLPLISNFVNYAIGAAASMYVAPKSMVIDMRSILQGDDIQKDVKALGVLWIRIHRANGLSKQDRRGSKNGGSDPYITIAFSKYGKPMYCTRVITDDLNPIFEESVGLLVTPELVQAGENLSVELWDSDRLTADDIVGKVELSIQKMIQQPRKLFPLVSKLAGLDSEKSMPGELNWEIGFFPKAPFRPALRTHGKNMDLPKELRDKPEFQDEKGVTNTALDDAVQHTPPDPLWPSGVLSVIVHQIVNLELDNIKGTTGSRVGREFEPAKPHGESKEEQAGHLPTSYCNIHLNDELIYRTRSKAVSSQPIFNAGTERFVRDWRSALVCITVRDQRNREHDPILGVVPLKLSETLLTSSQVTRWYPLDGGIGFGRVRLSLLFRSVETKLPPNLLGWDVGTFEFRSDHVETVRYNRISRLKLRTGGSTGAFPKDICQQARDGNSVVWDLSMRDKSPSVCLPVRYRYRSPVVFEFHVSGKRRAEAYATLWLDTLVDNEDTDIDIPIYSTKNPSRFIQNYITEENCKDQMGLEDLTEVGRLKFKARFKSGLDESHQAFVRKSDERETYETWEACLTEGVRTRIVESEVPASTEEMHRKSLEEGRDILKSQPEEAKDEKKWVSKDGTNWTELFKQDPVAYIKNMGRPLLGGGVEPPADPYHPELDGDDVDDDHDTDSEVDDESPEDSSSLGLIDADNVTEKGSTSFSRDVSESKAGGASAKQTKRTEERKHRGLSQWRSVRNAKFARDQGKLGLSKLKNKLGGGLEGRQPGVETELNR